MYQPQGGLLASERCIRAHVSLARKHGAEVHTHEAVQSWHVDTSPAGDGTVTVVTDKSSYQCKQLVMTAGAWMSQLVPPLQVGSQQIQTDC